MTRMSCRRKFTHFIRIAAAAAQVRRNMPPGRPRNGGQADDQRRILSVVRRDLSFSGNPAGECLFPAGTSHAADFTRSLLAVAKSECIHTAWKHRLTVRGKCSTRSCLLSTCCWWTQTYRRDTAPHAHRSFEQADSGQHSAPGSDRSAIRLRIPWIPTMTRMTRFAMASSPSCDL